MKSKTLIQAVYSFITVTIVTCLLIIETAFKLQQNAFGYISLIALIVSFLSGCAYLYLEFSKKGSIFYKIYMYSIAACLAFTLLSASYGKVTVSPCIIIPYLGSIAMYIILGVGKDMGIKVHKGLCIALLVCAVTPIIYTGCYFGPIGDTAPYIFVQQVTRLFIAVNACSMVFAKYIDKAERGRKL